MTILFVRHGSAGDPHRWSGDDAERPLDAGGRVQAERLISTIDGLLAGRPLDAVHSSRTVRCLQTVGPLATRHGLGVVDADALFEGGSGQTVRLVRDLAGRDGAADRVVVLCSHADVIPDVVRDVVNEGAGLSGGRGCAYASVWELSGDDGAVVHAHYHQ